MQKVLIGIVNLVTALRLVLLVVLCKVVVEHPNAHLEVTLWILLGLTDVLDGGLARYWRVATDFGRHFDVIVDKIVTVVATYFLWKYRAFPLWAVSILGIIVGLWFYQSYLYWKEYGDAPASRKIGKYAIALWGVAVIPFFGGEPVLGGYLVIVPTIASLMAFLDYKKVYGWRWWH